MLSGEAGNAKFDFMGGAITTSAAPPLKMPFQSIDLCQTRPCRVCIEHFTGGDRACFNPSVTLIGFLCAEKVGLDFAKAGLGCFCTVEVGFLSQAKHNRPGLPEFEWSVLFACATRRQ